MLVCRFKNKLKVSPLKSSFQTILQTVVYFVSLFQMIYFEVFPSCKFLLMTFSFIFHTPTFIAEVVVSYRGRSLWIWTV